MAEEVIKVKRTDFATFLNTVKGGTENWARMGKGITGQEVSYNASTEENQFIDENSGMTEINGYAPSMATTQIAYKNDPVFDFVDDLRQKRAIGNDAITSLLLVYIYDKTGETFKAEKQNVAISIESFGGDAGAPVSITYNIGFVGDSESGTVKITAGKPVFTKAGE